LVANNYIRIKNKEEKFMFRSKSKKLMLLVIAVMMLGGAISAHAASYENSVDFTGKILPDGSANTTLAEGNKTTSLAYGKVKVSSFSRCSGISCWMRSNVDGTYHYWTPFIVDISDKKDHQVKYCDASASYYAKKVAVDLRAENSESVVTIGSCKVSGTAYFN
jgi:hypothetical protein